ncbi:MAG: hypothetical protein K0S65_1499 [Labilithrix sp.]|nr:hypothetical protein [Labilithrix sp.]
MSDAPPVVWLEDGAAREDAVRALDEWARARGVRLGTFEERAAQPPVDPSVADRIEKELDRARLAVGAADADGAERALARAEGVLREHPELPQAAWLRAEVERAWSARWQRVDPRDEARARTAWENAEALDGGRVAGIGETTFPRRPKVKASIVVRGAGPQATLHLDGMPLARKERREADGAAIYEVDVAPAEHQLLATSDGRVIFASWVAITAAETATRLSVADGGACERDRFTEVRQSDGGVSASGVDCPRWIAAVPSQRRGGVLVARCERDACGPLLEWRVEHLPTHGPPQAHGRLAGWPAWATWTLIGIGAATAASVALVATGVFESRPVEPRFIVGGARQE